MPAPRAHSQLQAACRERDAEKAAFAVLLAGVEGLREGDEPPSWMLRIIGDLLTITKARVQYRKQGIVSMAPKGGECGEGVVLPSHAAVIDFASNLSRGR